MPRPHDYDLEYRPHSYWENDTDTPHLARTVKGELRRQVARELAEEGVLDPVISAEALSDEQRQAAGSLHPWFLGGEFLPDLLPHEVEIARVVMKSTTMDILSIRARRVGSRIAYRIVDEYSEASEDYRVSPKTSRRPLTLRQLIRLLDQAQEGGLIGNARYWNYTYGDIDPEGIFDFATISSEFYPELARWYDEANQDWLAVELAKRTAL